MSGYIAGIVVLILILICAAIWTVNVSVDCHARHGAVIKDIWGKPVCVGGK